MLSSESQPRGTRNSKRAPQGKQPSLLSRLSAPVGDEREEGGGGGVVEITSLPIASGDPSRRTRGARGKGIQDHAALQGQLPSDPTEDAHRRARSPPKRNKHKAAPAPPRHASKDAHILDHSVGTSSKIMQTDTMSRHGLEDQAATHLTMLSASTSKAPAKNADIYTSRWATPLAGVNVDSGQQAAPTNTLHDSLSMESGSTANGLGLKLSAGPSSEYVPPTSSTASVDKVGAMLSNLCTSSDDSILQETVIKSSTATKVGPSSKNVSALTVNTSRSPSGGRSMWDIGPLDEELESPKNSHLDAPKIAPAALPVVTPVPSLTGTPLPASPVPGTPTAVEENVPFRQTSALADPVNFGLQFSALKVSERDEQNVLPLHPSTESGNSINHKSSDEVLAVNSISLREEVPEAAPRHLDWADDDDDLDDLPPIDDWLIPEVDSASTTTATPIPSSMAAGIRNQETGADGSDRQRAELGRPERRNGEGRTRRTYETKNFAVSASNQVSWKAANFSAAAGAGAAAAASAAAASATNTVHSARWSSNKSETPSSPKKKSRQPSSTPARRGGTPQSPPRAQVSRDDGDRNGKRKGATAGGGPPERVQGLPAAAVFSRLSGMTAKSKVPTTISKSAAGAAGPAPITMKSGSKEVDIKRQPTNNELSHYLTQSYNLYREYIDKTI